MTLGKAFKACIFLAKSALTPSCKLLALAEAAVPAKSPNPNSFKAPFLIPLPSAWAIFWRLAKRCWSPFICSCKAFRWLAVNLLLTACNLDASVAFDKGSVNFLSIGTSLAIFSNPAKDLTPKLSFIFLDSSSTFFTFPNNLSIFPICSLSCLFISKFNSASSVNWVFNKVWRVSWSLINFWRVLAKLFEVFSKPNSFCSIVLRFSLVLRISLETFLAKSFSTEIFLETFNWSFKTLLVVRI